MSDTGRSTAIGDNAADLKSVGDAARQVGDKAAGAGADAVQQAKAVAGDAQARATSLLGRGTEKASSVADSPEAERRRLPGRRSPGGAPLRASSSKATRTGWRTWSSVARPSSPCWPTPLRTNDLQSLMGDLSSLARRQPALFVGATMAAGFALARVGRLAATGAASAPAATSPARRIPPRASRMRAAIVAEFGESALPAARPYPGDKP